MVRGSYGGKVGRWDWMWMESGVRVTRSCEKGRSGSKRGEPTAVAFQTWDYLSAGRAISLTGEKTCVIEGTSRTYVPLSTLWLKNCSSERVLAYSPRNHCIPYSIARSFRQLTKRKSHPA